jgi:hypothetical protein
MVYNVIVNRYSPDFKNKVIELRTSGKTFFEICTFLKTTIPKSTISSWCKNIPLPDDYLKKIAHLNRRNLYKSRKKAWLVNKIKRKKYLDRIDIQNMPVASKIKDKSTAMIALAMLCLGEASKSKTKHRQFSFGNSDPRIVVIFLSLLKNFEQFDLNKIRCTVQCRADQDTLVLEKYWRQITKIPKRLFYPSRYDPRTVGKPTKNKDYHGVLVMDYYDRNIQLTLESLANIVYNLLTVPGPIA